MRSLKCPKCQGPMVEGFMVDATYGANNPGSWAEGVPQRSIWGGVKLRGRTKYTVQSWRCQRCGFLENYATV